MKIQQLVDTIQESSRLGEVVDIGQAAFSVTLNLLSNTLFSVDLADSNSQIAREFKKTVHAIMEGAGKPNLADYFPVLRKIDPQGIRRRMAIDLGKLFELFDRIYDERVQLRKVEGFATTNDVLDTLIDIIQDKTEKLDERQTMHLFLDLFAAGTDTSTSTLEWAMAELLRNPNIGLFILDSQTLSEPTCRIFNMVSEPRFCLEKPVLAHLTGSEVITRPVFKGGVTHVTRPDIHSRPAREGAC
ncbi:hypothetical protein SLEP1_g8771 [Rubroshorea leprosula]|uniref:Cytochrome P450 n=1 Tax=Rubroshorea leprosula TaxID=152421 RepID=A0AAV5I2R5_9ROSI|nr:hypothetical protein SLEP1_g8771 [Rubroshorea leprosula]